MVNIYPGPAQTRVPCSLTGIDSLQLKCDPGVTSSIIWQSQELPLIQMNFI